MFGLGKSSTPVEEFGNVAPATKIHFHADLIEHLIVHQSQIYADFKALVGALNEGVHKDIEAALIQFKREFHSYLMEKNVKLYSYLKHSVDQNSPEALAINKSRTLNNHMSRQVNRFIDTYVNKGEVILDSSQYAEFGEQLEAIGKELVQSMRDERDNLFPIYDAQTETA